MLCINPDNVKILFPHMDWTQILVIEEAIVKINKTPPREKNIRLAFHASGNSELGMLKSDTYVAQFSRFKISWNLCKRVHLLIIPIVGLYVNFVPPSTVLFSKLLKETRPGSRSYPISHWGDMTEAIRIWVVVMVSRVHRRDRHVIITWHMTGWLLHKS